VSDLSPEARALLDAACSGDDPSAADRERVARSLAASLGVAALAPSTAQAATAAGGVSAAVTTLKAAAVVLALAAFAAGALSPRRAPRTAAPASAPVGVRPSSSSPQVAVSAPALPRPAPVGVAAPVVVVAPLRPARPTPAPVDSLEAELGMLGEAHRATLGGDPARALTLLAAHGERYPRGALRQERSVERVLALCSLGRRDEARAVADAFLRAHPSSPLAPRVEASCGRSPGPVER